jgi:4-amino-4-deoxy-L-arabinose transferase-like glycosyltransferase
VNSERVSKWAITLLVSLFILLGLAYSIVNPLYEATDELRHYRFVQHIVQRQSLPVQGKVGCSAQGHHPPLYYLVAAGLAGWIDTGRDVCDEPPKNPFWAYRYWEVGNDNKNQYLHGPDESFPWYGQALAAHLARAVNVLIGAAVVWLTWAVGRTIWPKRPYLAVGGAAIVAFNPMFLYMSGAINNDVIAALSGAAITWAAVRLLRDDLGLRLRWGVLLGLLFGLALLSKFNLIAMILPIEIAVTWVAWQKKQWRQWLQVNLLLGLFALLLAGWWFARNQILYGEPTGFERLTELWGVRDPRQSWELALFELSYLWTSLWGRFGYGQVPLPQTLYDSLWWLSLFALSGLLLPALLRQRNEIREYAVYVALLLVNVGLFFAVVFNYLLVSPAGPMGRFFFPALPSFALLLIYGLSRWVGLLSRSKPNEPENTRANHMLTAGVSLGLLIVSLLALFAYLAPAYAKPQQISSQLAIPNPTNAQFDTFVRLLGYEIEKESVAAGESVNVDLYWEVIGQPPGDYLMFIHMFDEYGTMVTQRDTHPGLGSFPSSQWEVGDRFIDTVPLHVPETAYTPATAQLSVGLYAPIEGYRLAVTTPDGSLLGDVFALGTVALTSGSGDSATFPNPLVQNFGHEILLAGYEYSQREIKPGQTLVVNLYWEALQSDLPDYKVQLRLKDDTGEIYETSEHRPLNGQSPTASWRGGDVVLDKQELAIPDAIAPGAYHVQVALIDPDTRERQNIVGADGHWIDETLRLGGLRVLP